MMDTERTPVNFVEHELRQQTLVLMAIADMLSSLVGYVAEKEGVATEKVTRKTAKKAAGAVKKNDSAANKTKGSDKPQ